MVAQRQPVDRVIDLVVGLPVATAVAAVRSIPLIRQASRQSVSEVTRRARHTLGSTHDAVDTPVLPAEVLSVEVLQASEAVPSDAAAASALPIGDYDHLAARQVVDRLSTLTTGELGQIELYERANRHRRTVLGRIAQLQS